MVARELGGGGAVRWCGELSASIAHARGSSREGESAIERGKWAARLLSYHTPPYRDGGPTLASGGHAAARCYTRSATTWCDVASIRARWQT